MQGGEGRHLTLLHIYTDYKITDKPIKDMTLYQYMGIIIIANIISKWKMKNKPLVVV